MMQSYLTELILIRHGETEWNRDRRLQGNIDIPLNETGLRQARALGRRLADEPFDVLYSSDLGRAAQTAQAIGEATGAPVRFEPGLRERRYGVFEGLDYPTLLARYPDEFARWQAREPGFAAEGGESLEGFYDRVAAALVTLAQRHAGQKVAVVTHGGVLDCAYRLATGIGLTAPRAHGLLNCSINRLTCQEGAFGLRSWGDVAHLDDAGDDIEPLKLAASP